LPKDVVGDPECLHDRGLLLDHLKQAVVLDHDQRVHLLAEVLDPQLRLLGALAPLERERPRHDAHRERAELPRDLGDHRRGARTGAAALAGGDEDHVRALEGVLDLVATLLCRGLADGGVCTGAETLGAL
jgi:hypothetical protein